MQSCNGHLALSPTCCPEAPELRYALIQTTGPQASSFDLSTMFRALQLPNRISLNGHFRPIWTVDQTTIHIRDLMRIWQCYLIRFLCEFQQSNCRSYTEEAFTSSPAETGVVGSRLYRRYFGLSYQDFIESSDIWSKKRRR